MTAPHILVPCKAFAAGKARLAPILDHAARRALCARFFARTIELALAAAPAKRVHVVTAEPEARRMAQERGVAVLDDRSLGHNEAVAAARDALLAAIEPDAGLLVLPIDLPLATPDDIRRVADAEGDLVIVPNETRSGTNVVLLRRAALAAFRFAYGPDSFARHRRIAEGAGLAATVVENRNLAFDIDEPQDYRRWQETAGPG